MSRFAVDGDVSSICEPSTHGELRVLELDYMDRRCIVEITVDNTMYYRVAWFLEWRPGCESRSPPGADELTRESPEA